MSTEHPVVFRPFQARFLTIPQTPISYWLRDRFFELLAGRTLGDVADVCQGLATADDDRFVRFTWETPFEEWAEPLRERRWVPFEKGGGYGKWFGHHWWVVDWQHHGARIKVFPRSVVRNEQHYFQEGWTYSYMARGSIGLRLMSEGTIFSHLASAIFFTDLSAGGATLNCRFAGSIVRSLSAKIQLNESYVSRVPIPHHIPKFIESVERLCVVYKWHIVSCDPTERAFVPPSPISAGLLESWRQSYDVASATAAILHALEGLSERAVFTSYGIAGGDLASVLDETGMPAGWHPLISGYNALPDLAEGPATDLRHVDLRADEPQLALTSAELVELRRRLRALYEAGPGARIEDEPDAGSGDDGEESDEDESEAEVSGARIPIPTETFLEVLSQKLEIHPISVYWLLRELREKEGVVSPPELRRYAENYLTVTILRLLGHRWPREVAAGTPVPDWADPDGIIPITEGTGAPALLDRVRERLAADFGEGQQDAVEGELRQILGRDLGDWLARDFFQRHVAQFRKRPIAWQLESGRALDTRWEAAPSRRGGRRSARAGGPAFACLVAFHRLTADTLTRVRTHVLRPVVQRREFELAAARREAAERPNDAQRRAAAERLAETVDELRAFDAALETVSAKGFWSPTLAKLLSDEEPDAWARRAPGGPIPDRDAFLRQEQAYDPDRNDGVRVNLAPLQKYGLLAADVLPTKDVDTAIADRAQWRADERRWCREGKLPRPGWWAKDD